MSRKKTEQRPLPTGKQIRKALIDLDISVKELAKAMNVSPYYIREIYAERRKAFQLRKQIAQHLGSLYKKNNFKMPTWAREIAA